MNTILFDFGGVLVDLNREKCSCAFAALGFDASPFIGTYGHGGLLARLDAGTITTEGFCNEIRNLSHNPELKDESIINAWCSLLDGVPAERLDMILKIKQHYHVSLLSNVSDMHWKLAESVFFKYKGVDVDGFFEKKFLSYRLKVTKPDERIYRAVIEGLGCPAGEILFLDDSEANCEAARRCGMKARLAPAHGAWLGYFTPDGQYLPNGEE